MKLPFITSSDKQKQAARAWADPAVTDIVYGGAKGGGKSHLGAVLIFGNALCYPNTRYFIARKKLNDLRKHTIPTIEKVFKLWKLDIKKYARFNGQDNCYHLYNGSTVLLIEAKYLPGDPFYERFGSMQMTQGWIEEAGEFEVSAMTNLSISIGRWENDKYNLTGKLLQTCNPKKNYLYKEYYLPWKSGTLQAGKVFIQAFAHENVKNEKAYVERLNQKLKGVDRERLLNGNWEYSSDADQLIEYDKIIDIASNNHVPSGRKCITADLARYGDKIIVVSWDGFRGKVKQIPKGDLPNTVKYIEAERHKLAIGKSDVLVDADGMGIGVVDFVGYKGFINNARAYPDPKNVYDEKGKEVPEQFDNLKSQCSFRMAERINKNGLYLEYESDDQEDEVREEMEQVRIKDIDSEGKKGVVSKEKIKEVLGRSPDHWDALMMREYFELAPKRVFADAEY